MKHKWIKIQLLFIVSISTLLATSIAPALAKDGRSSFVGLWQAIDSFDGSTQFLSVTCSRISDCDIRLNDTSFTLSCPNQIGFAQGAGMVPGREGTRRRARQDASDGPAVGGEAAESTLTVLASLPVWDRSPWDGRKEHRVN